MTCENNANGKLSDKVTGEDIMRTVEFLRGRLLAERVASRNAKEAAQLMGNKLVYLETKLKEETKSRNKAEKRLKFLKKKMEAMNISYVSDESENSSYLDHCEVSSIPFTAHYYSQEMMDSIKIENENVGADSSGSLSGKCEMEEPNDAIEENIGEANFGKSSKLEFNGNCDLLMANGNSLRTSLEVKEMDAEKIWHREENVDYSMAIVPVEMPNTKKTINPDILDATIREVLDSLRHAKEKLQTRMERTRIVKVG